MKNVTKRQIADKLADRLGYCSSHIKIVLNGLEQYIMEVLSEGNNIELRGFGSYKSVVRKAKIGRNPRCPKDVFEIPPRRVAVFKMSKKFEDKMKEK